MTPSYTRFPEMNLTRLTTEQTRRTIDSMQTITFPEVITEDIEDGIANLRDMAERATSVSEGQRLAAKADAVAYAWERQRDRLLEPANHNIENIAAIIAFIRIEGEAAKKEQQGTELLISYLRNAVRLTRM